MLVIFDFFFLFPSLSSLGLGAGFFFFSSYSFSCSLVCMWLVCVFRSCSWQRDCERDGSKKKRGRMVEIEVGGICNERVDVSLW